ncbi:DUF1853 family protein [Aquimarina sp. 2201CG14-23]|uniref:DUF1853 family protein n=1 Tax=Aquimarina mycalae TaxID=3040073 RepID=UPI002477F3FD|nr:DUF1853 family protein [Aquimarina sp. 2201CG14-23]MDH7447153.1 DUF1853 family protein [Aquimarina sp. 2201CG14-23]
MLSIKEQYQGFLDSHLLWKDDALFGLSQFITTESSKIIPNDLHINISDNEVLGKRIEHFFEYYLLKNKHYNIILKSLQIFKNKITIGELDFLIEDKRQQSVLHIELIYKFYLYNPKTSETELERWIGPNQKDSLLEKVNKLKEKQLPLLYRKETILALEELGLHCNNITQQICFFGNLFLPLSYLHTPILHLNKDCIQGFWIHSEEFTTEKYSALLFYIPQKKDWIVHPKNNKVWLSFEAISKQLKTSLSKKKSPLLWIKSNEDSFSKCFIVWW